MITRTGRLAGIAVVGALALAACGSDNNTSSSSAAGTTAAADTSSSATATSGAAAAGVTGTLNGEGSSAQKNAIGLVIADFQKANAGATVNYNATGSGAGVKQFLAGQVDFGGSDSALKTESTDGSPVEVDAAKTRCQGNPAWNIPLVAGPLAVSFNVKGVDKLTLTPELTAKIFSGAIKTWDDAALKAANTGVTLPAEPIKVFYRSDDSGTTDNFQKYLVATAPTAWTGGAGKKYAGKVGEGKPQNDGVATAVKATEGGVTYAEWSFAKKYSLGVAQIDNGAGAVELTGATAGAAVAAAKPAGEGNDLRLKVDYATKAAGTYPIILVTYEIVCSKGLAADKTALVKSFLGFFASPEEQAKLEGIQYAPLPSDVQAKVKTAIDAIS